MCWASGLKHAGKLQGCFAQGLGVALTRRAVAKHHVELLLPAARPCRSADDARVEERVEKEENHQRRYAAHVRASQRRGARGARGRV
jgi:hypothetical protein